VKIQPIKSNNNKSIYFKNHENIDENIFYENTITIFENNKQFKHIKDITGPSEDISVWELNNNEISLINDLDYGFSIQFNNPIIADEIISILDVRTTEIYFNEIKKTKAIKI